MENTKKKLDIKNISIALLILCIILLIILLFAVKKDNSEPTATTTSFKYQNETNETLCQRKYYYGTSKYTVSLCDNKLYINTDDIYTELNIENPLYLYDYYTSSETTYYIITEDKTVYEISSTNINNKKYELTKLDLKNIINIKEFYVGYEKEYAYSSGLYAIDEDGKMHLIKSS